ncbi:unnamed protein product, partial [marine sediment metagenome]
ENVPEGKMDDEGDELLDLYDEEDNLEDDVDYDLSEIKDDMLADETEEEELGLEVDDVISRVLKEKEIPLIDVLAKKGYQINPNAKVNIGESNKQMFGV